LTQSLSFSEKQLLKQNIAALKYENRRKEIFYKIYKLFRDLFSKYKSDKTFVFLDSNFIDKLKKGGWISCSSEKKVMKNDLNRRMGYFFEKIVAYRLYQFLYTYPHFKEVIAEVWMNYPIRKGDEQHREFMEGDILIVLKNATVINLECKTFKVTEQDIFSKMERFHQVSGVVNKSYLVLPVFTNW